MDIQNKIRTEFVFETKITMLNEEGNKINNECYSGTFLMRENVKLGHYLLVVVVNLNLIKFMLH